ncbi:NifB/NifX family molybdenum-iron cluster-binding protein [Planctomycetota bacterium]
MSENKKIRFAVPTAQGQLCMHFGHCEAFTIVDVDSETKEIAREEALTPPVHEPGVLPRWLADQQVEIVIAGGMGQRAQSLFTQSGIKVLTGASSASPADVVTAYMNDSLETGDNLCDH